MWPWSRKSVTQLERKSSTYFVATGPGRAALTGAEYNKLAKDGYAEALIAFSCINLIASAAASVEPTLYRETGKKLEKVEERHELTKLLRNPNPAQSGREFIQYLVSYHRLCGNAYIFGNGIDPSRAKGKLPTELQLLNPGMVKISAGETYFPKRYEYKPNPNQTIIYEVDQITGKSAVLHLKTFNPLNTLYGMSPLNPAALSVDIHTGGQRWNLGLLNNGARPSGALVVGNGKEGAPTVLGDEQYTRLKQMIDERFVSGTNAGKPMLLEGGLDWKEMSLNPKDMDFHEGKNSAARDIALSFGVPPMLLGIPGDNTYSNMQEAKVAFWTDTVLPILGNVYDGFNRWLTPLSGDDLYVWYDEETIPALEPLRKAKSDRINTATYLTIDEKRRAMGHDDYEPSDSPGGVLLVQSTSTPLEMVGMAPLPDPQPDPNADDPQADV